MSKVDDAPAREADWGALPPSSEPASAVEFHYAQTDGFTAILNELKASLLVTTYQANKLLVVRAAGAGLSTLVRTFDQPMGLAVDGRRLALGTRNHIWFFRDAPDIASRIESAGLPDACYLPRSSHVTGDIRGHEIAWAGDELWIVNTRFSCLCMIDPDYSFVPRWRPPFITSLAAEDRCHLNGLAMRDGRPRYVTALGETDLQSGWRPNKAHGGCLIDVPTGEIVARGLSMPHSPRLYEGRLWILESGTGRLLLVDADTGRWETIVELPGFARGLAIAGRYAFIGLSKIRDTSTFGGLPIAERLSELTCGVAAIDLSRGSIAGLLEYRTAVEEIFDVQLLSGVRFPEVIGFQQPTIHNTFILPALHIQCGFR